MLIKALLFFRNEKRDGTKKERNEIVEPEKRTGGGGRRPTEAKWKKRVCSAYGRSAVAQPMLMIHFMKKEDRIYQEPCYLFRTVLGRHFHTY